MKFKPGDKVICRLGMWSHDPNTRHPSEVISAFIDPMSGENLYRVRRDSDWVHGTFEEAHMEFAEQPAPETENENAV